METPHNKTIEPSDEMKHFMKIHQLNGISEVLKMKPEVLLAMDGFGMRLMKEWLDLSKKLETNRSD